MLNVVTALPPVPNQDDSRDLNPGEIIEEHKDGRPTGEYYIRTPMVAVDRHLVSLTTGKMAPGYVSGRRLKREEVVTIKVGVG